MCTTPEAVMPGIVGTIGSPTAPPPGSDGDDPPGIYRVIDNALPPALSIKSGDAVAFVCPGLPLPQNATLDDLALIDPARPHTIVGPVEVAGAAPGDTLQVDILSVDPLHGYGHTVVVPGAGLLGEDIEAPHIHNFSWAIGARHAELRPGVLVPLRPFCGILGVMPSEPGEHATLPPRATGGNLDLRHLTAGASLFLPVEVPGALFFAGDGHAAQGDGEVCVTAIETAVEAKLRLSVIKGRSVAMPQFATKGPLSLDGGEAGYFATSAAGPDLYECSQNAVRHMIAYLAAEHGLAWNDALVLCSLAVDLKINEIVNAPNWLVSAYLPLSVFAD